VTGFVSGILVLIPHLGPPSHIELKETRMTLEELCRGLNGRDFPHADQQRFADALNNALQPVALARAPQRPAREILSHPQHLQWTCRLHNTRP